MIGNRRFLGRAAAGILLFVGCGMALPSTTFAEIVGIEFLEWQQHLNGTARVDSDSFKGSEVDLQDDLGLHETDYLTQERLWLHFTKRSYLVATHLASQRTGKEFLTSPLVFGGVIFAPGDTIKSRLEIRQDSLLYRYDFIDFPIFKLRIPFGAERLHFRTEVESSATGFVGDGSDGGTFPVVGLALSIQPIPIIHVSGEAEGMRVNFQGNDYRFYDARGQVEFHFAPFVGLNLGYRRGVTDVNLEGLGKLDLTQKGPYATLTFRF